MRLNSSNSPSSSQRSQKSTPNLGLLGEDFIAEWLHAEGWHVLHRRWHCRWGELDIIAQEPPVANVATSSPYLVFVEVKTRSQGNWDADGMLAIAAPKQAKLWQAAQLFLAKHPEFTDIPCRFDVALVRSQRIIKKSCPKFGHDLRERSCIGPLPAAFHHQDRAAQIAGYEFVLQAYIQSAFESSEF